MRHILLPLLLLLGLTGANAQSATLRELFKQMPDSIMPYLSHDNRLDFIDFLDSKMKAEVTNLFDGKSEMTSLSDDSLSIRMSDVLTVDLFLLPTTEAVDSASQVLCLVRTLSVPDSYREHAVQFYSLRWHPLQQEPPLQPAARQRLEAIKASGALSFYDKILNKD